MATPKRIQIKRKKGWRLPINAVYVGRPGIWGNPFRVFEYRVRQYGSKYVTRWGIEAYLDTAEEMGLNSAKEAQERSLELYKQEGPPDIPERAILKGKDLACWCRLCERHTDGLPLGEHCDDCAPCHADHLLVVANQ